MAALTPTEFAALSSDSARADWIYSALYTEIMTLRSASLVDEGLALMLTLAERDARDRLAREIRAAQAALADTMSRAYEAAKVGE